MTRAILSSGRKESQPTACVRMPAAVPRILLVSLVLVSGCSPSAPQDAARPAALVERAHVTMGSEVRLTAWADDEKRVADDFEAAFAEFDRLDALMSVWREGSDVQWLNAAAGLQPVHVSGEVLEVLRMARQVSDWTGGKFDVTFAPLSDVWRFDHDQDNRVPTAEEIGSRLPLIDYRAVML